MGLGFRTLLVVSCLLALASFVSAQAVLTNSQVYVNSPSSLSGDLVNIPISFPPGTQFATFPNGQKMGALPNVRIGSFPTQVVATSYNKDGSVRTAMARVLITQGSGEQLYTINTSGNTYSTFSLSGTAHENMLKGINGSALKAVSSDLHGHQYAMTVGIQNLDTSDAGTGVELLENGPVARVYQVTRHHSYLTGTGSSSVPALPYLFTTTFWITVVNGKPFVKVDQLLTNSNNLAEDSCVNASGTSVACNDPSVATFTDEQGKTSKKYKTGQTGMVFYDNTYFQINTGTTSSSLYVVDYQDGDGFLKPSVQQDSGNTHTFYVMPTDGQNQLKSMEGGGPAIPGDPFQNNFLAGGQSLLTRSMVVLNGSVPSYGDYFEETPVQAGQGLARFNQAGQYFFDDVINPEGIDPTFDFTGTKLSPSNPGNFSGKAQDLFNFYEWNVEKTGYRFGKYLYDITDMGQGGMYQHYYQEPRAAVLYLMSCATRCQKQFLDALRWETYGAAHVTSHIVGLNVNDMLPGGTHNQVDMIAYRNTPFEGSGLSGNGVNCRHVYASPDTLGFCGGNLPKTLFPTSSTFKQDYDNAYRKDAQGNAFSPVYAQNYNTLWWQAHNSGYDPALAHYYTGRDDAHIALGMQWYRWFFSMDYAARSLAMDQINIALSDYLSNYDSAFSNPSYHCPNGGANPLCNTSTRGRGRVLINAAQGFAASPPGSPESIGYKQASTIMVDIIDKVRHIAPPSLINPLTGSFLPAKQYDAVGYFDGTIGCGSLATMNPNGTNDIIKSAGNFTGCRVQLFENVQVLHGLAIAHYYVISDPTLDAKILNMLKDGLDFVFKYGGHKTPSQVKNGMVKTVNGKTFVVNEGPGGFAPFNRVVNVGEEGTWATTYSAANLDVYTWYDTLINYTGDQGQGIINNFSDWDAQILAGVCNALKAADSVIPSNYSTDFLLTFQQATVNNSPTTLYGPRGIQIDTMTDSRLCGLHLAYDKLWNNASIPTSDHKKFGVPNADDETYTATGTTTCVDTDNDHYTNCVGDFANTDNQASPNGTSGLNELCSNSKDDILNGLIDCADMVCIAGGDPVCNTQAFCGNGIVEAGEQCDVKTLYYPAPSYLTWFSGSTSQPQTGTCGGTYLCIPPLAGLTQGCSCAATGTDPFIGSISPNPITQGTAYTSSPVQLSGGNFSSGAVVKIDGTTYASTFVSSSQINLPLSAAQTTALSAGNHNVTVTIGAFTTSPANLSVQSNFTLSSISPASVYQAEAKTFTLNGSGFIPTSQVKIGTQTFTPSNVNGAGTQITLSLTATQTDSLSAGNLNVTVVNGASSSNAQNLLVQSSTPVYDSASILSFEKGQDITFFMNGSNFIVGAQAYVQGLGYVPASLINSGLLRVVLTAAQTNTLPLGPALTKVQNFTGKESGTKTITVTPPLPADPSNLLASPQGTSNVLLSWTDNASTETAYFVERSTDNFTFSEIATNLAANTTAYTDLSLANGTYYYRVRASNTAGFSNYSNTATIIIGSGGTTPPQPDVVTFTFGSGTPFTSIENNKTKTLDTLLKKNQTDAQGYQFVSTMVVFTICRLDDPDPGYAAACQAVDTYGETVNVLYDPTVPLFQTLFHHRKAVNFKSLYPIPVAATLDEKGVFVMDGSGVSVPFTIDPVAMGLPNGFYRATLLVGPAQYGYTPPGGTIQLVTEADTSNNFLNMDFAIQDPAVVNPPAPPNPPATDAGGSSGGGGGSGGGSSSSSDGGFDIGDAIPPIGDAGTPALCVPSPELCNGVDDDCDGQLDESCSSIPLSTGVDPLVYGILLFFTNVAALLGALVQFLFGR